MLVGENVRRAHEPEGRVGLHARGSMSEDGSFDEMLEAMTPTERRAVKGSMAGLVVAMLAAPTLLCASSGREAASGVGGFVFDALVLELVGLGALVLVPLKAWLKRQLHGDEGRAPAALPVRVALTVGWIACVLGGLALLAPQGFFLLTRRGVAQGAWGWCRDGLAMLAAISPGVVAMGPWVWAARRAHRRERDARTSVTP